MDEVIKYLKDALGVEPEIKLLKTEKYKALPMYLLNEYTIKHIQLYHRDLLFVFVKSDFTTEKLRKHLDIIRTAFNTIAVAVINHLEAYKRLRLIEKKVPFIIPGKQMYLPDFLIDLKEYGTKPRELPKTMQPATQLLILYHLQIEKLDGFNLKEIAEKLMYDGATITRASFFLHNTGLCTLQGTKEKSIHFNAEGKELWTKAEPFMQNPVRRIQYYSGWVDDDNIYNANINAIAQYTDLNDEIVEYYAVRPKYLKFIGGANAKATGLLKGNICIEEWKYNPYFLTKTRYVDPLSLYLCFRGKPDERIEMALEQLIEKIKW